MADVSCCILLLYADHRSVMLSSYLKCPSHSLGSILHDVDSITITAWLLVEVKTFAVIAHSTTPARRCFGSSNIYMLCFGMLVNI